MYCVVTANRGCETAIIIVCCVSHTDIATQSPLQQARSSQQLVAIDANMCTYVPRYWRQSQQPGSYTAAQCYSAAVVVGGLTPHDRTATSEKKSSVRNVETLFLQEKGVRDCNKQLQYSRFFHIPICRMQYVYPVPAAVFEPSAFLPRTDFETMRCVLRDGGKGCVDGVAG